MSIIYYKLFNTILRIVAADPVLAVAAATVGLHDDDDDVIAVVVVLLIVVMVYINPNTCQMMDT